jgi:hypothetical protein
VHSMPIQPFLVLLRFQHAACVWGEKGRAGARRVSLYVLPRRGLRNIGGVPIVMATISTIGCSAQAKYKDSALYRGTMGKQHRQTAHRLVLPAAIKIGAIG